MAIDFSKLQADVAAQGGLIASVQTEVNTLKAGTSSSADQDAVDQLDAAVAANNAALQNILTPAST